MMKKLLLILLFYPYLAIGATNIDSLHRVAEKSGKAVDWNKLALYYEDTGDTTQLRIYAQKAYNLAVSEKNKGEEGRALLKQGTYYEYMGNIPVALGKTISALACFREAGLSYWMAEAMGNSGYYYNEMGRYHEAIEAYHEAINLYKKSENQEKESKLARAFINIGFAYLRQGKPDSVLRYNEKALEVAYIARDTVVLIETSNQLGLLYSRKNQYKEALKHYEEALRINLLSKNTQKIPYLYNNIATLYLNWGKRDFAIEFARKAEQTAESCGDLNTYSKILAIAGSIYARTELYKEAVEATKKSLSILQDIPFYQYTNFEVLALSYCMMDEPDSSNVYLSKMEDFIKEAHPVNAGRYYEIKGRVLAKQGQFNESIPFLEKGLELKNSSEKNVDKIHQHLYELLSEAYRKGPNNYEKALYYKQLQLDLSDSIHRKEHSEAMADFNVKYNTTEKELEIAHLKLQEEKLLRTRTIIITGLVVLAVLLFVAWLYVLFLRWKKKTEKAQWERTVEAKDAEYNALTSEMEKKQLQSYLEGLESERSRLAKEMHDHVSNGLLALEIKMESAGVPSELTTAAHNLHNQVRDLSHALMPPVFQYASLPEIIDEYIREQNKLNGPCFQFYLSPEESWESLPHQTALDLYRIVQEACSNALKHAHAKNITISLTRKDDQVELSVKDDGQGMQSSGTTGIGMRIINERATNQKGKVAFDSNPGTGTTITIHILV